MTAHTRLALSRKWHVASLALGLVAALSAVAMSCADEDEQSSVLTIYSGRSEALVQPLLDQFSEDTGIEVRVRYGDSAELAATILEEGENSPADVFLSQDAGALGALVDRDRLQRLPAALLDDVDARFRSGDERWVGVSGRSRVIVYNPDRVSEADLPTSVLQLTDPKWRNRVGWAPTNGSFQAFVTAFRVDAGEDAARNWLRAMSANGTRAYPNNTAQVQAVAAGEIDLALVNHYYLYPLLEERGDSFRARNHFLRGDIGALVNVAGVGVLQGASNTEGARELVEYLLSEPAQRYFADETFEYPLAEGVPPAANIPPLASLDPPDVALDDLHDLAGTLAMLRETGVLP